MATKVILKKSAVASKTPLVSDLDYGELALNYADGKLYYKTSTNEVAVLNTSSTSEGSSVDVGVSPPTDPEAGDLWWNSEEGILFIYYQDADTGQWVSIGAKGTAPTGSENPEASGSVDLSSISQSIVPATDIIYDLGSATKRWRDLYLSGSTINLGGATIKADATSGNIALVPKPTASVPNPTGVLISSTGKVTPIPSTNGIVAAESLSNYTLDLLVVAGGGSGGGANSSSVGAGGGAGGLIYKQDLRIVPNVAYPIVIGAGGAATSGQVNGNSGEDSSAFGFTAVGGGYGGTWGYAGGSGGSGGGGGGRNLFGTGNFGGPGIQNQGHAGGNPPTGNTATDDAGGGGGGSAAPGENGNTSRGGPGGNGRAIDIEGFTQTTYYAGGGGGGTEAGKEAGAGGQGGGGYGGSAANSVRSGTENTGGGGGGACGPSSVTGGSGGSGVVIIRTLLTAFTLVGDPAVSVDGSYNIYKFTGSGSITF